MTKVLLISGGIDSFCISQMREFDIFLYINTYQPYSTHEIKTIRRWKKQGLLKGELKIAMDRLSFGNTPQYENGYLPHRNAHLCLIASEYGDEIYIGSTKDDKFRDNVPEFHKRMSEMLTYLCEKPVKVIAPAAFISKITLVETYLNQGGSLKLIEDCFSCYFPGKDVCGECPDCQHKTELLKELEGRRSRVIEVD